MNGIEPPVPMSTGDLRGVELVTVMAGRVHIGSTSLGA